MWKTVESKERPELVDATSCKGMYYVRKNITKEKRDDDYMYVYEEALMTSVEYDSYSGQKIANAGTNGNQAIIMEALADIADLVSQLAEGGNV